jgi:hypothetical protein
MPDESHDLVVVKDPSIVQVGGLSSTGSLTGEAAASFVETVEQVIFDVGCWQNGQAI